MINPAKYILASYSFISSCSYQEIIDFGYESKEGNPIPSFDENVLIELCEEARSVFEKEDNILELEGDFIIVGDIHGSIHDLLRILKFHEENDSRVLFLGDYVDRGHFSLECITILFALKVQYPNKFYLIRGNHEFDSLCSQYGFKDEILNYHNPKKDIGSKQQKIINHNKIELHFEEENDNNDTTNKEKLYDNENPPNDTTKEEENQFYYNHEDMFCYKYTEKLYESFLDAFSYLPVCSIINKTNFCIHGGLSPRFQQVDQINKQIQRPITSFEDNRLFSDVLWSDPTSSFKTMFGDNPRGRGYFFNSDATFNFLNVNSLNRIIRGHQCVKHGSRTNFNEKCITVFSASSYSDEFRNKSGILKLNEKDDHIEFITFQPIDRLEKRDAIYYKVEPFKRSNEANIHACFSFRHPKLQNVNSVNFVPHINGRSIKGHQSVRLSKPLFRTFSRKEAPTITKPCISHSTSLDCLSSSNTVDKHAKGMSRSIYSLDNLSEFAENM